MKCVINAHGVVSDSLEGPLASHISLFSKWVSSQGYAFGSVGLETRIAAFFSQWLGRKGVRLRDVSMDHARLFLRQRARARRSTRSDRAALRRLIDFLQQGQLIPPAKVIAVHLAPVDHCVQGFERYLREDRALAEVTITHYVPFVRDLLKHRFGEGPVKLLRLTAADIVRFVQDQAQRLPVKQAKLMTTALRSFLRYARHRGELRLDLVAAVPIVANWSRVSIPRAIPPDQVRQLLSSIDRHTAMGRRDYAILLLLARLGLRAGQVASLELDGVDWSMGKLSVRGKGGRPSELPLPAEVGKAIAAYLRRGRPPSASRRLFLRVRAPHRGFQDSTSVSTLVAHALKRAGIDAPTRGAHQFRHGLASEMLRNDASLAEIGAVLGHAHPDTTRIYTKIDLKALRAIAQPWPGRVR